MGCKTARCALSVSPSWACRGTFLANSVLTPALRLCACVTFEWTGDESEDDSYGDSDDDNWSNTVSSPSHSKPTSSNSFRAAPAPASDPFGDDLGGMLGFNTAPAPASAPISIPAAKSSSSDTTENRDFFGFSYKTPIPAPAAAPGGGPDLYARPMPRVPAEESRPVRRKGPYLWDYTYKL